MRNMRALSDAIIQYFKSIPIKPVDYTPETDIKDTEFKLIYYGGPPIEPIRVAFKDSDKEED